jgi:hypothetical protein
MKGNPWARLLAYMTGLINQELLLKNEYLAAENRILRAHLSARMRLSDPERSTLGEIGKPSAGKRWRRCLRGSTWHNSGLVPEAHCAEVLTSRPSPTWTGATLWQSRGRRVRRRGCPS